MRQACGSGRTYSGKAGTARQDPHGTGSRQHYSMGVWSCRAGIHWQYMEHRNNDRAGRKGGQYDHIQRHSTPGHGRTGAAAAAGGADQEGRARRDREPPALQHGRMELQGGHTLAIHEA